MPRRFERPDGDGEPGLRECVLRWTLAAGPPRRAAGESVYPAKRDSRGGRGCARDGNRQRSGADSVLVRELHATGHALPGAGARNPRAMGETGRRAMHEVEPTRAVYDVAAPEAQISHASGE